MPINFEIQLIFTILNADNNFEEIQRSLSDHKKINWEKFNSYSIKHGVAAFMYNKLASNEILYLLPDNILALFKQQYYKTFARNSILIENLKLITEQVNKFNIELILLKGISLIDNVYEDIGVRPMSDIDILINEMDIPKITHILEMMNYSTNPIVKSKFIEKVQHFHLPAYINNTNHIMIELHTHIQESDAPSKLNIKEFWNNKIPTKIFHPPVGMLSPENLLLHLCMHIHRHFQYKNIRLSHFYDIAQVIKKYNNHSLNWNKFIDDTNKFNLHTEVFPYLFITQKYLNVNLPNILNSHFNNLNKAHVEAYFIDILLTNSLNLKELAFIKQKEIKIIKGSRKKIMYIFYDLFPSKRFMIRRYKIKNKFWFFLFYIKRWGTALNRLIFILFGRGKK